MQTVVGYVLICKEPKSKIILGKLEDFAQTPCRVLEFSRFDGSALVVNSKADALNCFEKEDIIASFKCSILGDIICPPNLNEIERMAYAAKVMSRKGGYNELLRRMVISASLHKGEFNDNFLFQNQ
jgi:hypothetical protein